MTLTRGFRFGSYEVLSLLGVGGMGEVYRARDAKLNRDVALKILPDVFAADADRCARFEREAQILASLSHPAIGSIYGLEDSQLAATGDGAANRTVRALVLELIEGPTLADELINGAMPVPQALEIARQIAEALEAAHESGIVHRDLKPANIKLRPDGLVKVLDFGLAKAMESPAARAPSGQPRTLLSPALTEIGVLFGTPAYMSPEQVRGRAADERSDVWAFGCVLYEMLTGKRAFPEDETSDVMAAILRADPDWTALPTGVPPSIRRLLQRCLAKDRARRLRDIGDARLEIEDARLAPDASPEHSRGIPRRAAIAWLVVTGVAVLAAAAAARWTVRETPAPEMRLDITTGETTSPASFAISPDGRAVVFSVEGPRGSQLWVRSLESTVLRAIADTEDAQYPFWSPDSRSIGFFTAGALKRVDVDGGRAQTLAPVLTPAGGSWSGDGTIVFVPNDSSSVFSVPATGGESRRVTPSPPAPAPGLPSRHPHFLPDGRHFLFYVAREDESGGIYVGDLGGGEVRRIVGADTPAVFGAGYLWYVNESTLFAQPFDLSTQGLAGPALRVAQDVVVEPRLAAVSASAGGPIAYRSGTRSTRQLAWLDRTGRILNTVGEASITLGEPALSPDQRQLLVQQAARDNVDVWMLDLERGGFTRLTVDPWIDSMPVWSPDGSRFAFNTAGGELRTADAASGGIRLGMIGIRRLDGAAPVQQLASFPPDIKISTDWSSDGRFVLVKQQYSTTATWDLWALPVQDGGAPVQVTSTPYDERDGQFSPDAQSVAFESNESGTWEIYVQSFPNAGAKRRVSTNGGRQVRWRRDGAELYYIALDGTLMSVAVAPGTGGLAYGVPTPLFKTRIAQSILRIGRQQYVVTADGERFLMVTADETPPPPITLLLNWQPPAAR